MTRIEPADFAKEVNKILNDYGDQARDALDEAIPTVAKKASKDLQGAGSFNGTAYRKGWKAKTEKQRLGTNAIVYNASHYHLTHLLEFGHAKQNGGRTAAFQHIAPVNDQIETEVLEEFEKRI